MFAKYDKMVFISIKFHKIVSELVKQSRAVIL